MPEVKKEKYVSCKWLESGVCFDNGVYGSNVKLCCYMSAPGGGNAMIFKDYNGEKIDWDEFFRIKEEYRAVQKSGKTVPECEGCVFLTEGEWEQSNYLDNIVIDHFTKCNCRCSYCYTEEDKKKYNSLKTYNIYPIIKDMFDKKLFRHGGGIGFGGGEPTILPEFDKLIDLLLKNNFDDIRVPSSGIKYSKMVEKGISAGQLSVVVSIDSSSRETYKKIKQVDAFDTVCKNLKKYAKAQKNSYNVISKYIIIPGVNDNKTEIDNWLRFNKKNRIEILIIDIENSWLNKYRNEKPDEKIIELLWYVIKRAREAMFFRLEVCDRAKYLLKK